MELRSTSTASRLFPAQNCSDHQLWPTPTPLTWFVFATMTWTSPTVCDDATSDFAASHRLCSTHARFCASHLRLAHQHSVRTRPLALKVTEVMWQQRIDARAKQCKRAQRAMHSSTAVRRSALRRRGSPPRVPVEGARSEFVSPGKRVLSHPRGVSGCRFRWLHRRRPKKYGTKQSASDYQSSAWC